MYEKVTAVIPTRDREPSLTKLVDELVSMGIKTAVVNNGDCDVLSLRTDVEVTRVPPSNLSDIFNICLGTVSTEYVLFWADDIFDIRNVDIAVRFLEANAGAAVVTGPIISEDQEASEIKRFFEGVRSLNNYLFKVLENLFFDGDMYRTGFYCSSGFYTVGAGLSSVNEQIPDCQEIDLATSSWALLRTRDAVKIGGFSKVFKFNHVDGDFFLRLREKGRKIIYLKQFSCVHSVLRSESRNPYFIGLDTAKFLRTEYKIDGFKHNRVRRFTFKVCFPLFFVVQSFRNPKMLEGLRGYLKGLFGKI